MDMWLPLLFLPALGLWALAAVAAIRAMKNVRHDQTFATRVNPIIWLSEWRMKATFDEKGQAQMAFARRMTKYFLFYCLFLLILLISLPRADAAPAFPQRLEEAHGG